MGRGVLDGLVREGMTMAAGSDRLDCPPEVAALCPASLAREDGTFPLECMGTILTIAVGAPLADEALDRVEFVLNREIRQVVHPAAVVREAIRRHYGEGKEDHDLDVCWCWPTWRHVAPDGTLDIKASGWEGNTHWTGSREIKPDDPDYAFWRWLVDNDEYDRLVDERELPEARQRWARSIDHSGPNLAGTPPEFMRQSRCPRKRP